MNNETLLKLVRSMISKTKHPSEPRMIDPRSDFEVMEYFYNEMSNWQDQSVIKQRSIDDLNAHLKSTKEDLARSRKEKAELIKAFKLLAESKTMQSAIAPPKGSPLYQP